MKKLFFILLFFPALLYAQAPGGEFTVTGSITGLANGVEVKLTNPNDNTVLAESKSKVETIVVKAKTPSKPAKTVKMGKFVLNGSVPEPGLYLLTLGKEKPQYLFLENTAIKVNGSAKDLSKLKITGSQSQKEFDEFRTVFTPLLNKLNTIASQVNQMESEEKRKELMEQYNTTKNKVDTGVGKFVAAKPASYVSLFLMAVTAQLLDEPLVMEQRFNLLSENIRNSVMGKSLSEFITYNKVGAVGTDALEFTQTDTAGNPVSLSSFRGKYVLVDFWASWCRPCRMENPNVVKTFHKFNNKNFTVFGVSLDREKEPWIKAIKTDSLAWTQVSDLKFWENSAAVIYHVKGIPQNFLIDPNGKIIGKNLRGEELEAKLCEILGCN